MSDDKNQIGRQSRRRFLSLTATGASAWGLTGLVGASSERQDQIPIAKSGDEVVATREVPRAWREHLAQAKQARANVAQRLQGAIRDAEGEETGDAAADGSERTTPSTTVGLEPADQRFGDRPGFRVRVREVTENRGGDRARQSTARPSASGAAVDAAPAEANGIPVRTEKTSEFVDFDCPNRGYYDPVPGGVAVYTDETGDETLGRGTATTAVRKKGSPRTYLLSAAHIFSGDNCLIQPGEPVYLADDPNETVGEVTDYSVLQDFVLIDDVPGSVDWANEIREGTEGGVQTVDVDGHLSEDGVAYWLSEGKEVSKSGSSTGTTSGTLTEMYVTGDRCATYGGHAVSTDAPSAQGDSGSPVYATIGGDAYMVSMLQQGQPVLERSDCGGFRSQEIWGTAAYRMHDVKNLVFDV